MTRYATWPAQAVALLFDRGDFKKGAITFVKDYDDFHERMGTAGLVSEINFRPTLLTGYV